MKFQNTLSILLLLPLIALNAEARDILNPENTGLAKITDPDPSLFSVCYGNTCHTVEYVSLTPQQWEGVRAFFQEPALSAREERQQIANAIAYLEVEVGKQINSLGDRGGNLKGFFTDSNQLDCIDESTNSTSYMHMMQNDGLLRFHRVQKTATRGFLIIGGWPHTTAVIKEIGSDQHWAVDSWFRDNGALPDIVTLEEWRSGWDPEDS